jgi:hypothetical protein
VESVKAASDVYAPVGVGKRKIAHRFTFAFLPIAKRWRGGPPERRWRGVAASAPPTGFACSPSHEASRHREDSYCWSQKALYCSAFMRSLIS